MLKKTRTERLLLSLGDDDVDSERSKEIIEKIVDSKIEEDDCQLILDKLNEVIEELNAEYNIVSLDSHLLAPAIPRLTFFYLGLYGFDSIEKVIERVERNLCKRRKTINAERSDVRMAA